MVKLPSAKVYSLSVSGSYLGQSPKCVKVTTLGPRTLVSCADPGIFVMGGGGRGLQAQLTEKKHSDNVFLGISLLRFYRGVQ